MLSELECGKKRDRSAARYDRLGKLSTHSSHISSRLFMLTFLTALSTVLHALRSICKYDGIENVGFGESVAPQLFHNVCSSSRALTCVSKHDADRG